MTDEKKTLQYREAWQGEYRGVTYEITHWRLGWNYYLHISINQLPDTIKPMFNLRSRICRLSDNGNEYVRYDYSSAPIISELDWHGGITLYEKTRDGRGEVIGYRLGCDYMHLWDEGKSYNVSYVEIEAERSIDKLWEYIPNLKLCCAWNGRYYDADEVYYTDKRICVALENKEKWEKPL